MCNSPSHRQTSITMFSSSIPPAHQTYSQRWISRREEKSNRPLENNQVNRPAATSSFPRDTAVVSQDLPEAVEASGIAIVLGVDRLSSLYLSSGQSDKPAPQGL